MATMKIKKGDMVKVIAGKDKDKTHYLEEVFENREQIEISRYYEKLPKPTLIATEEFLDHDIYWHDPAKDRRKDEEDDY